MVSSWWSSSTKHTNTLNSNSNPIVRLVIIWINLSMTTTMSIVAMLVDCEAGSLWLWSSLPTLSRRLSTQMLEKTCKTFAAQIDQTTGLDCERISEFGEQFNVVRLDVDDSSSRSLEQTNKPPENDDQANTENSAQRLVRHVETVTHRAEEHDPMFQFINLDRRWSDKQNGKNRRRVMILDRWSVNDDGQRVILIRDR